MQENICTIPIHDVFGPKDGCPMCRLHHMLEERYVEYITGAAMMEPDVRMETNKTGFCHKHLEKMVYTGKKLPNALLLETHLEHLIDNLVPSQVKGKPNKKDIAALESVQTTCFVCDKIDWAMNHMMKTIFASWQNDEAFNELYSKQEYICIEHYTLLMKAALNKGVAAKNLQAFYQATAKLTGGYLQTLKKDMHHFSSMFDYRSQGKDWGNSKDVLERTVAFLTAAPVRKIEDEAIK